MCSNCHAPWETGPVHGSFDYLGGSHGVDGETGITIPYNSSMNASGRVSYSGNTGYY